MVIRLAISLLGLGLAACVDPPHTRIPVPGTAPAPNPPPGMVYIPGGEFEMGDSHGTGYLDERPAHPVRVDGFWIERTEVTQSLWDRVVAWSRLHGYAFEELERCPTNKPSHPICNLSWYDAVKWANARSEMEGRRPAYYADAPRGEVYRRGRADLPAEAVDWRADGYRLPTEAEWERAARGGLERHQYPWPSAGPDFAGWLSGDRANFWQSGDPFESEAGCATTPTAYYDGRQTPAGRDMTNAFGLYDLSGNVAEWCWDLYHDQSYARPEATTPNPRGPASGYGRVLRGGSWISSDKYCRVSARYMSAAGYRCHCFGVRFVVGAGRE